MTADFRSSRRPSSRLKQDQPKPSFKTYYSLIKPGIVYANVLTGTAGYLLASKWQLKLGQFLALIIGMSLLIGAACIFNNVLDRRIDERMERTKKRAIVTGQVSIRHALSLGLVMLVIGLIVLRGTNKLTLLIGILAVVFYVIIYGFAKRHSVYSTLVGTLPGAASLVAGYTTFTNKLNFACVLLLALMICWQMAHFYAIAIYRLSDYKGANLPLWPIKRGLASTVKQIRFYVFSLIIVSALLSFFGYSGYSFLGVMVVIGSYWLHLAYKPVDSSNATAWAKKVFIASLAILLIMAVMLPVSRLIV